MLLIKKKRLFIVIGLTMAASVCIGGFVALRLKMIRHNYLVARDKGYAEYQHGDSVGTVRDLGTYLSAYPEDASALEAYAESRLRVEQPDGSHLFGAIGAFRRLSDLRPESDEIRRRLVVLYSDANLNTECVLATDKLLTKNPKDAELLHFRALAQLRLRKFKDSMETMDRYLAERPRDLEAQILQLEIRSHTGPPDPNLVDAAAQIRTAHPDDVRWKLLQSVAYGMAGDTETSKKWAADCASASAPDAQFARLRVLQLWQTGQVSLGDAALTAAMKQFDDSIIRIIYLRRLYQLGRYEELTQVLAAKDEHDNERALRCGYQCLAWVALKDMQKAEAGRTQLMSSANSVAAQDWAVVLGYDTDSSRQASTSRVRIIKEIMQRHPDEAYFQMALASANLAGGDIHSAMLAWQDAAMRERAWAAPVTRMAETLLAVGRTADALKVGQAAIIRGPEDRDAMVVLALVKARAGLESERAPDQQALLSEIDRIHGKYRDEQRILALRVLLRAKLFGKAEGVAALTQTLDLQPPPSIQTLLQLATVSRSMGLGEEKKCFSAAERLYGVVPELAFAEAISLAQEGHIREGAQLLDVNRGKATKDRQTWEVAYARYMEICRQPEDREIWVALSDKYPSDVQLQWLVLSAPSVQGDHALAGRTIERIRLLIGENDFSFKLARASWLLSEGNRSEAASITEATALLTDMSKGFPDVLAPHLLLAGCLERTKNFSGAIEQLEIAAALAPESKPILLELARLLEMQGNMERAGMFVNQVLSHADLTNIELLECAGLLSWQGQSDRAISLLEASLRGQGDKEQIKLYLAELYDKRGQTHKAEMLVDELMKTPDLPIVRSASAFYALHNRMGDARKALGELESLKLDAALVALQQGDFESRFGKAEDAIGDYERSLQKSAINVQAWYRLIGMYIQLGKTNEALTSLDKALEKVPDDEILLSLKMNREYIRILGGEEMVREILLSLISAPLQKEPAELVLKRLNEFHQSITGSKDAVADSPQVAPDSFQLAVDISRLADRYPQYAALQNLAVTLDVAEGVRSAERMDDAVRIATRAMQTFPSASEPARWAALAYAESERWSDTLDVSNEWRLRSPDRTLEPDVMIARSYLEMGKPDETLRQIEPYMAQAIKDPDSFAPVIVLVAQSEIIQNNISSAEKRLWALAITSKRGMATFMQIAGASAPPAVGEHWLKMAHDQLNEDMDLEVVYVTAVATLSKRSGNPSLMDSALHDMEHLVASSKAEPEKQSLGYLAIGMLQEERGFPDSGEAAYRHAVELNPKLAPACNNLAMVLARRGALAEALTYANAAVKFGPRVPMYEDTLASVEDKEGNYSGAIEHALKALQLESTNPEWRINLAQAYVDAKEMDHAHSMLINRDGSPYKPLKLKTELQDRLSSLQDIIDAWLVEQQKKRSQG